MKLYVYRLEEEEEVEVASPSEATPIDSWSDLTEFTSGDVRYYTVEAQADSSAAQTVLYLADIRNILLMFLLFWLILSLYYRLKNTISSFFS